MNRAHVWYELMTERAPEAAAFYAAVVGWDTEVTGPAEHPYTLLNVGETRVAGIMVTPDAVPAGARKPVWRAYVLVNDIHVYIARMAAAGGRLLAPAHTIEGIGEVATVADPHGAAFVLFKPASQQTPTTLPEGTPGAFGWHELHADDSEAALAFYASVFGWRQTDTMPMGELGTYRLFATDELSVGGIMTRMLHTPRALWLYYVHVANIDTALERVTHRGGEVLMQPHAVAGGYWIAPCKDPQGAEFALMSKSR